MRVRTHLAPRLVALGRDGVQLVDEEDGGRVLLRVLKRLLFFFMVKCGDGGVRYIIGLGFKIEAGGHVTRHAPGHSIQFTEVYTIHGRVFFFLNVKLPCGASTRTRPTFWT